MVFSHLFSAVKLKPSLGVNKFVDQAPMVTSSP